jgi:ribosomal protein S27E
MEKETTYVTCHSCDHWDVATRQSYKCQRCNNTQRVVDPRTILCNLCGECMCPPIGTMNEQIPHGLYKAKVLGGYDSYHLLDMNTYTFSFCEECLRKLFVQCKIKPDVRDTSFDGELIGPDCWERDQEYYEYRVWESAGGKHQAYLNGKCNTKKECPNKAMYTRFNSDDEFTEDCACEEHKPLMYQGNKIVPFIPNVLKPFL